MKRRRIMGVFAHPDDEVFCAGGTIASYTITGDETMIVSATRGEAGQIRDTTVATRASLGRAREAELRASCRCLGVEHVRLLDHRDGTLQRLDRAAFVAEIGVLLDEFEPDVVVTFGPDGLYGHPDHVAVGEAVTQATASRGHARLYHSYFPRTRLLLLERLAEWLVDLRERFAAPADFARVFSLFASETSAIGFADDHIDVAWFPPSASIIEQGEAADTLYLVLSGEVEVTQDRADGTRSFIRREGPGAFFGEVGIARRIARTANVSSVTAVTCLVFSPGHRDAWATRGPAETDSGRVASAVGSEQSAGLLTVIDVRSVLDRKIAALAAHRTQYPIDPEMFPNWLLEEMMGHEWFVRVQPPPQFATDLFA